MSRTVATYSSEGVAPARPAPAAVERANRELATMVSHDLKNPLALIKGRIQLLRRELAREASLEPARLSTGLAQIEQAAAVMAAMLDELADLSTVAERPPRSPARHPTDLVALARHVATEYQLLTGRHRIRVRTTAAAVVGQWDGARLERALVNLVSNAIKYSPDGGEISIVVAWDSRVSPPVAVLRVRDRGIGIPGGDLPRIFDGFHRGRNAVGRASGTGIGLMAVREIVERHGGTVTAQSREGRWSKFTLRLPLARPVDQRALLESPSADDPTKLDRLVTARAIG